MPLRPAAMLALLLAAAHPLRRDSGSCGRGNFANHRVTEELELRCDGVAVATLRRFGRGPESLVDGIVKMTRYNEAIGATASAANYVSIKHRRQFIREVAALFGGNGDPAVSRRTP
jgi:hypothetical protein